MKGIEHQDSLQDVKKKMIFVSYSHEDKKHLKRLHVHLKPLEKKDIVDVWDDTKIKTGEKWRDQIELALSKAAIAILIISADFLASDFIHEHELHPLLEASEKEGVTILWVAVRLSMYQETPIGKYQSVNDPSTPLESLPPTEQDRTILDICKEIKRRLVES